MCAAKPGSLPDSGASSGSSSSAAVSQTPPGGRMKAPTSSPSNAAPAASNLKPPVKAYRKVCNFSSRCGIGFLESSFACGHVLGLGFHSFVCDFSWILTLKLVNLRSVHCCKLCKLMLCQRTEIPKASNVWPNMGELCDGVFNAFLTRNRDA